MKPNPSRLGLFAKALESDLPNLPTIDEPNSPPNINVSADPLAIFENEVNSKSIFYHQQLTEWMDYKAQLIGNSSVPIPLSDVNHSPPLSHECPIKKVFANILNDLRKFFSSASANLDRLLETIANHLKELTQQKDELFANLSKAPTEQKPIIKVEICNTVIIMLNELIGLMNAVAKEIKDKLAINKFTQEVLKILFQFLIEKLLGLNIPPVNNLWPEYDYRASLNQSIQSNAKNLRIFTSTMDGALKHTELELITIQKEQREHKPEDEDPVAAIRHLFLLGKNESLPVDEQDQAVLDFKFLFGQG